MELIITDQQTNYVVTHMFLNLEIQTLKNKLKYMIFPAQIVSKSCSKLSESVWSQRNVYINEIKDYNKMQKIKKIMWQSNELIYEIVLKKEIKNV